MSEQNCNCAGCGKPITGEEYGDRQWRHEPDCPNVNGDSTCWCDLEYHAACAPDDDDSRLGGETTDEQWYVMELQTLCIDRGKALDLALCERDRWRRAFYALVIIVGSAITVALVII